MELILKTDLELQSDIAGKSHRGEFVHSNSCSKEETEAWRDEVLGYIFPASSFYIPTSKNKNRAWEHVALLARLSLLFLFLNTHSFTTSTPLETMETILMCPLPLPMPGTPGPRPQVLLIQLWKIPYWHHLPSLPSSETQDQSSANFLKPSSSLKISLTCLL